jgi:hypothetical protein
MLRQLRKLLLGETWTLPLGVGLAVAVSFLVRGALDAGRWWPHAGGFLLLGLVIVVLAASIGAPHRRTRG